MYPELPLTVQRLEDVEDKFAYYDLMNRGLEVLERMKEPFIGKDIEAVKNDDGTFTCHIDSNYFIDVLGEQPLNDDDLFRLCFVMFRANMFSTRSKLMQAGLEPWYRTIKQTNSGIEVNMSFMGHADSNYTDWPDQLAVGRLFNLPFNKYITDTETLAGLLTKIPGGEIDEEAKNIINIPITRYYKITAREISVRKVLAIRSREELDKLLKLRQCQPKDARPEEFIIGESDEVDIPDDIVFTIVPATGDTGVVHYPSTVIDPNFRGRIRFEMHLGNGYYNLANVIPFFVSRINQRTAA